MALSQPTRKPEDYGMDEDAFIIIKMMDKLLDAVVGVYEQMNVPLPARRYWMMGVEPAEDCEQLVICYQQTYLGSPGDQAADPQQCNQPRTAVINIHVSRPHPAGKMENGKPLPAEQIMEYSKWAAIDAAVLAFNLSSFNQVDPYGTGPGVIATVNSNSPSGNLQTTTLNISRVVL